MEALERFISDGVDYIILDPILETGYDEVLQKAKDADIPVIIVDRNIVADESLYTCWVGSDFVKEGEDAAEWLKEYLSANGRNSETIHIVTIQGTIGASAQIGRSEGFQNNMAENWIMLDEQSGDFTEDGDVILISFDATKGGFQRMVDGQINVDIECNPLEGPLVAELIQKLEKGEAVEKIQYVEESVFPAETEADIISSQAY